MDLRPYDIGFMRLAISAARDAAEFGNTPFGAVLARDDAKLAVAGNEQITGVDCTAHAELALVRKAMLERGLTALVGTTVYASGEPCAMCAGALFWAGVSRVVYGATTDDITRALGGPHLPIRCAQVLAHCSPDISVEGPLLREEAVAVLQRFSVR
ncbi:MAG TPA: nucleoside deaminase [Polyangiales bacterium]